MRVSRFNKIVKFLWVDNLKCKLIIKGDSHKLNTIIF